jgi:uncharacterized protein (DUF2141 family)
MHTIIATAVCTFAVACREKQSGVPASVSSPAAAAPSTTRPAGAPLTVRVVDLRNHAGNLIFGVIAAAEGFPNVEKNSVFWQVKAAGEVGADGAVTFTTTLPPGRYGASVLHDENRSGEMDRGLGGIPKEGYGVTNNPKPRFRAATFNEATFDLPPAGATLTISVQYF